MLFKVLVWQDVKHCNSITHPKGDALQKLDQDVLRSLNPTPWLLKPKALLRDK